MSVPSMNSNSDPVTTALVHEWNPDPADHAETPLRAYRHVAPLLEQLAKRLRKPKAQLRIYDPYFCEGRVVKHMKELGFHSVYNVNEDFYATQRAGKGPEFDVLVTAPPFSGDHLERIHEFATSCGRPWLLLQPQYCARKSFYLEWLKKQKQVAKGKNVRPFFVGPTDEAYVFAAPARADVLRVRDEESLKEIQALARESETKATVRTTEPEPNPPAGGASASVKLQANVVAESSHTNARSFPVAAGRFQCVWFLCLHDHQAPIIQWWQQQQPQLFGSCTLVLEESQLPQLVLGRLTPAQRRYRKKLRKQQETEEKKNEKQKQQPGVQLSDQRHSKKKPAKRRKTASPAFPSSSSSASASSSAQDSNLFAVLAQED